jgi:citrate/tricarballylate utilization protein
MELRHAFAAGDIAHLAHLCHDCRACYYACMYAPPHEFGMNIPQILSAVRHETYQRQTWPGFMRVLFRKRPVAFGVVTACVLVVTAIAAWLAGPGLFVAHAGQGAFYEVVPYWAMLVLGLGLGAYWMAVWTIASVRFWRESNFAAVNMRDVAGAVWDVLRIRWLRGGGAGCPYPSERPSHSRRIFHSLVFYGFIAALASTTSAAIYQDLLRRLPPYSVFSLPVVLGSLGGLAMVAGCVGFWFSKLQSDQDLSARESLWNDYLFLFALGMTNVTGVLTLLLRDTALMGITLAVHLGLVAALFVSGAHGKFIHSVYRMLALVQNHAERRKAALRGIHESLT